MDRAPSTLAGGAPEHLIIAGWTFHASAHQIERDGKTVKLEPKAALVLTYLAQHAGEPIGRDQLLEAVWPGVIVSDEALTNTINKLRRAFGDERQHPRIIETIPKMGYRLIAEIGQHATIDAEPEEGGEAREGNAAPSDFPVGDSDMVSGGKSSIGLRTWRLMGGIFLSAGVLFVLGFLFLDLSTPNNSEPGKGSLWSLPDKPSVAVLPFANLSDDPEQEYFADGITEDLITDLSRLSELYVISRNSVFAYKGQTPRPQDVAQQLGASYVLEGSVRKVGDRIRINVDFNDASTGHSLWAKRFDGKLDDVFKLQDKVTQNIVSTLAIKLTESEQVSLERPRTSSVESLKHYFLGRAYYGSASKQENELARRMFQRAIAIDPGYAQAYAALALTYLDDSRRNWGASPDESIENALKLAKKSIDVDKSIPQAHFVLGYVYLYANALHAPAIAEARTAIAIDPNYAEGYSLLSSAYFFSGNYEKSLLLDRKAMRLNPASSFLYYMHQGRAYYFQGRYPEAIEALRDAEERNYSYIPNHLWMAATYGQMENISEAEWEIEQVRTLEPDLSIQDWVDSRPYKYPRHREQLIEGFRKAGLLR